MSLSTRLPLLIVVLTMAVSACSAAAEAACERIPGVRPGVCLGAAQARPPSPAEAMPVLGEPGAQLSLADFAGQVVVVNFWASWCGPCRAEQPELNAAHASIAGADVAFVGVNVEDPEANALAHEREFAIPYPSLHDPAVQYAARFEGVAPRTLPTTILVDREGGVAVELFGTTTQTEVTVLAELLADEGATGG